MNHFFQKVHLKEETFAYLVLTHQLNLLLGEYRHVFFLLLLSGFIVGRGAGGLRLIVQVYDLLVNVLHHLPHLEHIAGRETVPATQTAGT